MRRSAALLTMAAMALCAAGPFEEMKPPEPKPEPPPEPEVKPMNYEAPRDYEARMLRRIAEGLAVPAEFLTTLKEREAAKTAIREERSKINARRAFAMRRSQEGVVLARLKATCENDTCGNSELLQKLQALWDAREPFPDDVMSRR